MTPKVMAVAVIVVFATIAGVGGGGCREAGTPSAREASRVPVVCVVNYPLAYFASRIAGGAALVRFPAPGDEDPAFWKPGAEEIAEYQSADLILLNGAGYARWVAWVSLPTSRLVDTSEAFASEYLQIENSGTHSHGPAGEHSHSGIAFTTWLDFRQAIEQARSIHEALAELLPGEEAKLSANLAALESDLQNLDSRMGAIAEEIGDEPIVASHPVYQYWARRYGLSVESVVWEPARVPDAAALDEFDRLLAAHRAKAMVWEAAPDPRTVELLAERGLRVIVFDPCANVPAQGDFQSVMANNLAALNRQP